jgi:hypothetical protein
MQRLSNADTLDDLVSDLLQIVGQLPFVAHASSSPEAAAEKLRPERSALPENGRLGKRVLCGTTLTLEFIDDTSSDDFKIVEALWQIAESLGARLEQLETLRRDE